MSSVVVAGLAFSALGCAGRERSEPPAVAVRVEPVGAALPPDHGRYSGTVEAQTRVDLAFRIGGYVSSLTPGAQRARPLQAGDRVTRDMVLATLRQSDYRHKLSEADGLSAEAGASYRKAKADHARAKALLAEGTISQADYDATRARLDALSGSAGAAAARVGQMRVTLADTQLRSPLDGIVLERSVEVGALVAPGAPAFSLADTSVVRVVFAVPDSVQRALALGDTVAITTDAAPERAFRGVLTKLAAQADPRTRSFVVEASVANPDGILKVGMVTALQLGAPTAKESVLAVPLAAVVRRPGDGQAFTVFVASASSGRAVVHARTVELGSLVGSRVSVTRGLSPGEPIVVQGASMVSNGVPVAIVPAAALAAAPAAAAASGPGTAAASSSRVGR